MSFLQLDRLSRRYDGVLAVDDLSLEVTQGEFIALLGPSGCGKTTTLQMIAGFVAPSGGRILLEGQDLTRLRPAQRGLGVVFQSYALFPHMTVAENVAFGLDMQGVRTTEQRQRVGEVLEMVGLSALADRYPRRMSGGQQQRVALARALVIRPRILLLDEPLSNLDAKLREEMQLELRHIQRSLCTTTLLVTHDQSEAMALADRIVIMNKGRVEQIGAPFETYEWPATPFVARFLGRTNLFEARVEPGVARVLIDDARWPIEACNLPDGTSLAPGAVMVSVRPEKLSITPVDETTAPTRSSGIRATVRSRIFQGNHWLIELDHRGKPVTATLPNSGGPPPAEGSPVRVDWAARDMRIRSL